MKGPVPQNLSYHDFVDQRSAWGIPNFFNVITNLPFLFIGALGLNAVRKSQKGMKTIGSALFIGFVLLSFGSAYYHWSPNNETLVYDRLPMALIFMSFFALLIYNGVSHRKGLLAFYVFNIFGILSVVYWALSEQQGNGDLRWYGMVQFFPILAIPILLLLYRSEINLWKEIILIYLFFGLAKFTETFDAAVYRALGDSISGHSIKHLLMAAAGHEIIVLMRKWMRAKNI